MALELLHRRLIPAPVDELRHPPPAAAGIVGIGDQRIILMLMKVNRDGLRDHPLVSRQDRTKKLSFLRMRQHDKIDILPRELPSVSITKSGTLGDCLRHTRLDVDRLKIGGNALACSLAHVVARTRSDAARATRPVQPLADASLRLVPVDEVDERFGCPQRHYEAGSAGEGRARANRGCRS